MTVGESFMEAMAEPLPKDFDTVVRLKPPSLKGGKLDTDTAAGRIYRELRSLSRWGGKASGAELLRIGRTTGLSRTIHQVRQRLPEGESIPAPEVQRVRHADGVTVVSWYWLER